MRLLVYMYTNADQLRAPKAFSEKILSEQRGGGQSVCADQQPHLRRVVAGDDGSGTTCIVSLARVF